TVKSGAFIPTKTVIVIPQCLPGGSHQARRRNSAKALLLLYTVVARTTLHSGNFCRGRRDSSPKGSNLFAVTTLCPRRCPLVNRNGRDDTKSLLTIIII